MKIFINEEHYKSLTMNENMGNNQTMIVKDLKTFLDKHFKQGVENIISNDGKFIDKPVIGVIQGNQIVKNIKPIDLFYQLEDEVKNQIPKSSNRDTFIRQVIMDWFNNKITREGSLSKNITF